MYRKAGLAGLYLLCVFLMKITRLVVHSHRIGRPDNGEQTAWILPPLAYVRSRVCPLYSL